MASFSPLIGFCALTLSSAKPQRSPCFARVCSDFALGLTGAEIALAKPAASHCELANQGNGELLAKDAKTRGAGRSYLREVSRRIALSSTSNQPML
jgi:hypothetical protein